MPADSPPKATMPIPAMPESSPTQQPGTAPPEQAVVLPNAEAAGQGAGTPGPEAVTTTPPRSDSFTALQAEEDRRHQLFAELCASHQESAQTLAAERRVVAEDRKSLEAERRSFEEMQISEKARLDAIRTQLEKDELAIAHQNGEIDIRHGCGRVLVSVPCCASPASDVKHLCNEAASMVQEMFQDGYEVWQDWLGPTRHPVKRKKHPLL